MAYVAIAVVVLAIVALVVVKVVGGSSSSSSSSGAPSLTPAPASLISQITSVPPSVAQEVGLPSAVNAPEVLKGEPALSSSSGKPQALFIGAEFCPLCGAERWAMIMAFSKFGSFSGLQETTSSPWDTPPAIATFSFAKANYTSNLIDFTTVEHQSNDSHGLGTRTVLQPLTAEQQKIWSTYSSHFGIQTGYPFIDFNNKVFVLGPSYSPYVLEGLNQAAIAAKLKNPTDPVTQGIVGTSNYLTAAICSMTGQQPGSVCTAPATVQADKAMGLSS
jgi:uncharacterized protein DUF929